MSNFFDNNYIKCFNFRKNYLKKKSKRVVFNKAGQKPVDKPLLKRRRSQRFIPGIRRFYNSYYYKFMGIWLDFLIEPIIDNTIEVVDHHWVAGDAIANLFFPFFNESIFYLPYNYCVSDYNTLESNKKQALDVLDIFLEKNRGKLLSFVRSDAERLGSLFFKDYLLSGFSSLGGPVLKFLYNSNYNNQTTLKGRSSFKIFFFHFIRNYYLSSEKKLNLVKEFDFFDLLMYNYFFDKRDVSLNDSDYITFLINIFYNHLSYNLDFQNYTFGNLLKKNLKKKKELNFDEKKIFLREKLKSLKKEKTNFVDTRILKNLNRLRFLQHHLNLRKKHLRRNVGFKRSMFREEDIPHVANRYLTMNQFPGFRLKQHFGRVSRGWLLNDWFRRMGLLAFFMTVPGVIIFDHIVGLSARPRSFRHLLKLKVNIYRPRRYGKLIKFFVSRTYFTFEEKKFFKRKIKKKKITNYKS